MPSFDQISSLVEDFAQINLNGNVRPRGFCQQIKENYIANIEPLQQLNFIYFDRLRHFKQTNRFSECKFTISDISNDVKVQQIIGIFKRNEKKRIRAFESQFNKKYQFNKQIYNQQDEYQLEDETGKVRLDFTKAILNKIVNPLDLPYGIVIACEGTYRSKMNKYIVKSIRFPKFAYFSPLQIEPLRQKYILAVNQPSLQQLARLKNAISTSKTQTSNNIEQLIIIGGLNYNNINQIRQFDRLVAFIGQHVDTYLIPSTGDAKQHLFPLRPYHKCLLQKIIQGKNVGLVANPQQFRSKQSGTNLQMLVSCGQNLANLKANCRQKNQISLMKNIINYGHICPSSTFSLGIESYNFDPLILKKIPHIMIHGKCSQFIEYLYEAQNIDTKIKVKFIGLSQGDIALISLDSNEFKTIPFYV